MLCSGADGWLCLTTPGVMALMQEHGSEIDRCLKRHFEGDWGNLCDEDRQSVVVSLWAESGVCWGRSDAPFYDIL
jgi:hypothetical protein